MRFPIRFLTRLVLAVALLALPGQALAAMKIAMRVLDANGKGRDSDVIAAIERAIALKSKYNIRVLNLSLGRPVYQSYVKDPLCQAVEKAWKAGIVVVVAVMDGLLGGNLRSGGPRVCKPGDPAYRGGYCNAGCRPPHDRCPCHCHCSRR